MNDQHPTLEGLRVAAFESRRANEVGRLIAKFGGVAHVSPAVRELPLSEDSAAADFVHRLLVGEVGLVIFLTGTGFQRLLDIAQRHVDRQRYLDALVDVPTIARGLKPAFAMREVGVKPTHLVDKPCTWREVLTTIDQHVSVDNMTVAVQEYGEPNPSLTAGLEARGARVMSVPVYRWALPEDLQQLQANVRRLAAGELDVLVFTAAIQVANLFHVIRQLDAEASVRKWLHRTVVASIGPTTSDALRRHTMPIDLEPELSRMGHFMRQVALHASDLHRRKQRVEVREVCATGQLDEEPEWQNGPFMRACRREPAEVTPVWMMRQAGRYMAEYRQVREKVSFLELCKNPGLCSEVMCTAVQRLGVDAAIIFSDLLPILEPMGLELEFTPGPIIRNPVRDVSDVDRVLELEDVEPLQFVVETVRQTRRDLPPHIPLIGFAGAPFTLASYAIEGGASRDYRHAKSLMYRDPGGCACLWNDSLARSRAI